MTSFTQRPSPAPTTAAPAVSTGQARADRPFYFPNQHQRSASSEVSNKQLPALPTPGHGYAPRNGSRGRSTSAGSTPRIPAPAVQARQPNSGAGLVALPPSAHNSAASRAASLSSRETRAGDGGSSSESPPQLFPPRTTPRPPPTPNPAYKASPNPSGHSRTGSQQTHSRTGSQQTRYMNMLLTLDKIPRVHNILAAIFTWNLLAGFVILPATFSSQVPTASGSPHLWAPLLGIAVGLAGLGFLGMIWLALFWRHNYIWLLNRLYMPGTLNALAGAIATLTAVYSQHRGYWSPTAVGAIITEASISLFCGALFFLYNNLLLSKVKRQHRNERNRQSQQNTKGCLAALAHKWRRISRKPSFAPGSVV